MGNSYELGKYIDVNSVHNIRLKNGSKSNNDLTRNYPKKSYMKRKFILDIDNSWGKSELLQVNVSRILKNA